MVRIAGDDLGLIRYCVSTARFRRVQTQAHVEPSFAFVPTQRWQLHWRAGRQRLNACPKSLGMAALGMGSRQPVAAARYDSCMLPLTAATATALDDLVRDEPARYADEERKLLAVTSP